MRSAGAVPRGACVARPLAIVRRASLASPRYPCCTGWLDGWTVGRLVGRALKKVFFAGKSRFSMAAAPAFASASRRLAKSEKRFGAAHPAALAPPHGG
jgi:hypothetical protein